MNTNGTVPYLGPWACDRCRRARHTVPYLGPWACDRCRRARHFKMAGRVHRVGGRVLRRRRLRKKHDKAWERVFCDYVLGGGFLP